MKLLIDADPIVYRAGFASEQKYYQGVVEHPDGDISTFYESAGEAYRAFKEQQLLLGNKIVFRESRVKAEPVGHALHLVNTQLEYMTGRIQEKFSDAIIQRTVFLTGPGNFREKYATIRPYKGNRDPLHKPVHYKAIRDYLISHHAGRLVHGREADDEVSILAHQALLDKVPFIVATIDKDLDQIPGLHYDYRQHVFYDVSPDDAVVALWTQILAGDSGDNVPGCYRMGPAKAHKIAQHMQDQNYSPVSRWDAVVGEYRNSQRRAGCPYKDHDPEKVALETARLVYMLQKPGELWFPEGPLICEGGYDD